jgi:hypothetical protein
LSTRPEFEREGPDASPALLSRGSDLALRPMSSKIPKVPMNVLHTPVAIAVRYNPKIASHAFTPKFRQLLDLDATLKHFQFQFKPQHYV